MSLLAAASWTPPVAEAPVCDVYVGWMPIQAPAFAPKAVPPALVRMGVRHFFTVLRERSSPGRCVYFDFLPASPQDPLVMAAALLGQGVLGVVQERRLPRPPSRRCWWVGSTQDGSGLERAGEFNRRWDLRLLLFRHDCRHHTDGLVRCLTGVPDVTSQLHLVRSRGGQVPDHSV